MLTVMRSINLGLGFILELAMLAAFVYWGFQTGNSTVAKIGLGFGVPLLAAIVWGGFMAPRASRRLQGGAYLAVKAVLFGLAVAALLAAGQRMPGIVLAAAFTINTILLEVWK